MWYGGEKPFTPEPFVHPNRLMAMNLHIQQLIKENAIEDLKDVIGRIPYTLNIENYVLSRAKWIK